MLFQPVLLDITIYISPLHATRHTFHLPCNDSMQFDALLEQLDGFGRYQWLMLLVVCLVDYPVASNHFTAVFVGIVPPHVCRHDNTTTLAHVSDDQCSVTYNSDSMNFTTNQTVKCSEWQYDNSKYESTIISEVIVLL